MHYYPVALPSRKPPSYLAAIPSFLSLPLISHRTGSFALWITREPSRGIRDARSDSGQLWKRSSTHPLPLCLPSTTARSSSFEEVEEEEEGWRRSIVPRKKSKGGGEASKREKVKVKRGGNCGGSLIAVAGLLEVTFHLAGEEFFSSLIILYRGVCDRRTFGVRQVDSTWYDSFFFF